MKITKIREVKTPTRGTECSAGLDFFVPAGIRLCMLPGDDVLIPSGIKVEVPHGYALIAHNRSSMATSTRAMKYAGLKGNPNSTRGCVVVGACVVDEDYQGECFRLMDVDDEDYDRIKNYVKGHRKNGKPMYISESQQYKLAGNSIVVACMEHIFEQLFFPSGRVTEPRQLDIFDII